MNYYLFEVNEKNSEDEQKQFAKEIEELAQ